MNTLNMYTFMNEIVSNAFMANFKDKQWFFELVDLIWLFNVMSFSFDKVNNDIVLFTNNWKFVVDVDYLPINEKWYDESYIEYLNNEVHMNDYFVDNSILWVPISFVLTIWKTILTNRSQKLKLLFPDDAFHLCMIYQHDEIQAVKLKCYKLRDWVDPVIDVNNLSENSMWIFVIEI